MSTPHIYSLRVVVFGCGEIPIDVSLAFVRGIHRWQMTSEFPAQRASDAENVSFWWRNDA